MFDTHAIARALTAAKLTSEQADAIMDGGTSGKKVVVDARFEVGGSPGFGFHGGGVRVGALPRLTGARSSDGGAWQLSGVG